MSDTNSTDILDKRSSLEGNELRGEEELSEVTDTVIMKPDQNKNGQLNMAEDIVETQSDVKQGEEDKKSDEEEEDSDFGSFDEASFSDFEEAEPNVKDEITEEIPEAEHIHRGRFTEDIIANKDAFDEKLKELVDELFPLDIQDDAGSKEEGHILSERSLEIFNRLGSLPHLNPPNWTRSKIRHNLLIQLGVPVNLDEFSHEGSHHNQEYVSPSDQKSKKSDSIDWKDVKVPPLNSLNLTPEDTKNYIQKTDEILSAVETENLNNTSESFLINIQDESVLDKKLISMQKNHDDLIKLASIWNNHLDDLMEDFNTFEEVVQNYVGYSQKLRRHELIEKMKKMKQKSKKSKIAFWK